MYDKIHQKLKKKKKKKTAISFSRGSSWPRDRSHVSYISGLDFLKRKLTITTNLKGRKKRREVGREGGRQRNRQAQKEEREVKARKSGHGCRRALKLLWWLRLRFLTQLSSQQFLPSVREPNGQYLCRYKVNNNTIGAFGNKRLK